MSAAGELSWFPAWAGSGAARPVATTVDVGGRRHPCLVPRPQDWPALGEGLRAAGTRLRDLPVADVVAAVDAVCARWGDRAHPPRLRARADIVAATGFSPEAVDRSLDVELANYRREPLDAVLRRELGDPAVLDGFRPDRLLGGRTAAIGPAATLAVCTGNVPGLPALPMIRALLVKSPVVVKVAAGEPTFAAHFARELAAASPVLGDAVLVTYWTRDDTASLRAVLDQVEAVIAYGGPQACAAVRAELGPRHRYVEHGHKVSVGLLDQDYLARHGVDEVAARVARDVSMFNQHACIAPVAYLVERGPVAVPAFAAALAGAMADYAEACPLGTLDAEDAAALRLRRTADAWDAAGDPERDLWCGPGLDWAVTVDTEFAAPDGTGNRVVRVVPVDDLGDAVRRLEVLGPHLQNVGLGTRGPAFHRAAGELARLGASRISEPGRMSAPSVVWRHDGRPCVADLVRWCDVEMHDEATAGLLPAGRADGGTP